MRGNPFTYGNPISDPRRFFGRIQEVEQIFGRLRNPEFESSSLVGDRRIGKTSLLKYVGHPASRATYGLRDDNYCFIYTDLQMVGAAMGPTQLWRHLLALLREQCRDNVIVEALEELLVRERLDMFDLDAFFRALDARRQHVVFMLDEFDQVTTNPNFGPDFFFGFRSLASHRNLALVTSSRMELVELCHSESVRSSPFFNIFANIDLTIFSANEFESLISQSLGETGVRFSGDEIGYLLDLAGLHPFFVQTACYFLYEAYCQGLDPPARQGFLADRFQREVAQHFVDFWGKSSDPQRIVLTAAALLERKEGRALGFAEADMRNVYSRAEPNLAVLERRGLMMHGNGGYRLTSSVLGPWILDQMAAQLEDQQSFADWLAQNKGVRAQVRGRRGRPLKEVLPRIGPRYRQLILTWASDPQSVVAMANLLKSVLNSY